METSLLTIIVALSILVLRDVYILVQGWRKGKLRYSFKVVVNSFTPLVILVSMAFLVLFFAGIVQTFEKAEVFANGSWLLKAAPVIWTLMLFWALIKIANKVKTPILKYNDSELDYRKQEYGKQKEKAPRWLKWLYKKNYSGKELY